jgi:hypothetical protein
VKRRNGFAFSASVVKRNIQLARKTRGIAMLMRTRKKAARREGRPVMAAVAAVAGAVAGAAYVARRRRRGMMRNEQSRGRAEMERSEQLAGSTDTMAHTPDRPS